MQAQLLVGDIFNGAARAAPDRVAVVLGNERLTFGELHEQASSVARRLLAEGLGRGDVLGVWSEISLDLVVLHAATAMVGCAFVPLDPGAPLPQTRQALQGVGTSRLAVDDAHAADARQMTGTTLRLTTFDQLFAAGSAPDDDTPLPMVQESDAQTIFLTSGSTGEPKGVVLSHRTQWIRSTSGALPDPRGITVSMFPLFHMAGWIVALQCWQARSTVVLCARADAETILGAVERHGAQRLYAIPAVWQRLLAADPDGSRGATLRVIDTGTSATPPELLARLADQYPMARRRVFYGSTEAGPVFMLAGDEIDDHPGTVGRPQPGVEAQVSPEGELEVRGVHLFSGYLDGSGELDPARRTDGWFPTGDLAEFDSAGIWSIVGRVRQVIRTGGESVSPQETEAVLGSVSGVKECAVIGLPHPDWGEIVVAVVVRDHEADEEASLEAAMTDACLASLTKARRPRRYEFCDSLPRTSATGQVRRAVLVERLASGLTADGGTA